MNWDEVIKGAGPYTAPLCIAMGVAIKWLLAERQTLVLSVKEALERERQLRDKRTDDLLNSAKLLATSGELVKDALGDHDRTLEKLHLVLERVLDTWKNQGSSPK